MLVNSHEIEIEWGDCDAAGIVFYPRYFAMFEIATGKLFERALGMKQRQWCERYGVIGIPMVETGARFKVPSSYGDIIRIESGMVACRRSSFDVAHKVYKGEDLAIEASETRVWTGRDPQDPARLKARQLPDGVVAAFEVERS